MEDEGGRLQAPIKAPSGRLDQMHTPEQEMPEKGRSESKGSEIHAALAYDRPNTIDSWCE